MGGRAIVTGSGGFIGQHLVKYLKNCGQHISGIDVSYDSLVGLDVYIRAGTQDIDWSKLFSAPGPSV
ncbi:NAD-dependent epimerase/dehydratase family protein, partial [Staphylococcus aureus]